MAKKKIEVYIKPPIPREALRWTDVVKPDIQPPQIGLAKGFLFNSYALRVEPACTSYVSHCFGYDDHTTTQDPRSLFSTKLLALRAMRHEVEIESAERLGQIDRLIQAETEPTTA